ncbi:vacuolar ATPase assembly integral membrane protein vma21 [Entomortierella beljakovae]|nr:vacuolar ATPase assembly integral membrane protein vma21 [Entomortierella beljakovae]
MERKAKASTSKVSTSGLGSIGSTSSSSTSSSNPRPGSVNVATSTLVKLGFFTVAMVTFPIGTYFLSIDRVFGGNATYAGISAAVVANLVLFAYVIAAILEDAKAPASSKKQQ